MIVLSDSIFIKCTQEKAYNWFMSLDKNYKAWHPNHVECIYESKGDVTKDTIITSKEYLHKKLHVIKMKISSTKKNESIVYTSLFPFSILSPQGSFIFENKENGIIFTATIDIRLGKFLQKIFRKRMIDLVNHMKEEGINARAILERQS
jgi:hypothetical protein